MATKTGRKGPLERLAMSQGERSTAAKRSRAAKKGAATRRRKKLEAERAERAKKARTATWDEFNARGGAATNVSDEPLDSMAEISRPSRRTWDGVKGATTFGPEDAPIGTIAGGYVRTQEGWEALDKVAMERNFAAEFGPAVTGATVDWQATAEELKKRVTHLEEQLMRAKEDAAHARITGIQATAELTKGERRRLQHDRQVLNIVRRVLAL